jgi:16S rRNA G966 N2-methylase RsmD
MSENKVFENKQESKTIIKSNDNKGTRFSNRYIKNSNYTRTTDKQCADYSKFVTVKESEYSSLTPHASKQVANIISKYFKNEQINNILDATAHIGCDSVNFHIRFNASVICVENDEETYNCLVKNLETFNNNKVPTYPVLGNCLEFIKGFKQQTDFVYLDPPWGGPDYKKYNNIMLYLYYQYKKIPLYDVFKLIYDEKFTQTIVLKVPYNFNFRHFKNKVKMMYTITSYPVYKYTKKNIKPSRVLFYIIIARL